LNEQVNAGWKKKKVQIIANKVEKENYHQIEKKKGK